MLSAPRSALLTYYFWILTTDFYSMFNVVLVVLNSVSYQPLAMSHELYVLRSKLSAIFNPQTSNENHLQNVRGHPDQHPLHRFGITPSELC